MRDLTLLALTVGLLVGPAPVLADAASPKPRSATPAAKTSPTTVVPAPKANARKITPASASTAVKPAQDKEKIEDEIDFSIQDTQSTSSGEQRLRGSLHKKQEDTENATRQKIN